MRWPRTVGQFPRLIMIMFGVKGDLTTALGWYACIYFWEGLLAFAYAISLGLSCVAREKKFGTSEYLFTKPVERKTIVLAKVIVSAVNLAGVRPVQRRVQLFHDRSSFGRSGSAGSGAFHNDGNVLYPASLFLPWVCCLPAFSNLIRPRYAPVRVFVLAAYVLAFTAEYTGNRFLDYLTPLRYYDVYEVALNGVYLSYHRLNSTHCGRVCNGFLQGGGNCVSCKCNCP